MGTLSLLHLSLPLTLLSVSLPLPVSDLAEVPGLAFGVAAKEHLWAILSGEHGFVTRGAASQGIGAERILF